MRFASVSRGVVFRYAIVLWLAAGAVAGAQTTGGGAPDGADARIESLRSQLALLEQQTTNLRRDVLAQLDQIDATRRALESRLAGMPGGGASAAGSTLPGPAIAGSSSGGSEAAAPEQADDADDGSGNRFLRLVFAFVILGSIIFMARIFASRWWAEDRIETSSDMGSIRVPARHAAGGRGAKAAAPAAEAEEDPEEDAEEDEEYEEEGEYEEEEGEEEGEEGEAEDAEAEEVSEEDAGPEEEAETETEAAARRAKAARDEAARRSRERDANRITRPLKKKPPRP